MKKKGGKIKKKADKARKKNTQERKEAVQSQDKNGSEVNGKKGGGNNGKNETKVKKQ